MNELDVKFIGFLELDLEKLIAQCEEIQNRWNGDESGQQEDDANDCREIAEKTKELLKLLYEW